MPGHAPCRLFVVWLAFAETLALDDWAPAFTCKHCGQHPATIVVDGTAMICTANSVPPMRSTDGEVLATTGRYVKPVRRCRAHTSSSL